MSSGLIAERLRWAEEFKRGASPHFLAYEDYKLNRLSESWRASRAMENFFEYVFQLERKVLDETTD